jgi:hypothetical protein
MFFSLFLPFSPFQKIELRILGMAPDLVKEISPEFNIYRKPCSFAFLSLQACGKMAS